MSTTKNFLSSKARSHYNSKTQKLLCSTKYFIKDLYAVNESDSLINNNKMKILIKGKQEFSLYEHKIIF